MGGGSEFIRKSELIATGKCDTSALEKYGSNEFVVDDDIIKKEVIPYYTTVYIPNIDLGIYYAGYSSWAYSFYMTISSSWRQYLALVVASKDLLDLGYNIKGNLTVSNLATGRCVGVPKVDFPTDNTGDAWNGWYQYFNLNYYKNMYINNSAFPYSTIPAATSVTYDLQKARYRDSNFFIITLDNLNVDQVRRTCGINSNFTYTKSGAADIPAIYAGDTKFY